jgi:rhodanese-related sulfurtransferase
MLPGNVPTIDLSEIPSEAVMLDVREDEEWVAGHIDGARHVPMFEVPQHVGLSEELSADVPIVVVCRMGGRSAQVTAWLNQHGFQARNLDGGMLAWAQAGRPMVSEDGTPPRVA